MNSINLGHQTWALGHLGTSFAGLEWAKSNHSLPVYQNERVIQLGFISVVWTDGWFIAIPSVTRKAKRLLNTLSIRAKNFTQDPKKLPLLSFHTMMMPKC